MHEFIVLAKKKDKINLPRDFIKLSRYQTFDGGSFKSTSPFQDVFLKQNPLVLDQQRKTLISKYFLLNTTLFPGTVQ
jgi:hypothetical protein